MAGKRESLRHGKVVELKPGVQGRLNFQDQTLELTDGRKLAIAEKEKRALFPANEQSRKHALEVEEIEQNINATPFGEFFHQVGQKGPIGGLKDWGERWTRTNEEYKRKKQADQEVSQRIEEESPWTSGAATGASILGDLALTRGMSAAKAVPLLTGVSAGSRVLDEPGQVAAEAALGSAFGKIADVGGNYLNKVVARRAASRAIPAAQEATRAQNLAGEAATTEANLIQRQNFNAAKERVSNENAALVHQHNLTMNDRQNRMIQAKNTYEQAKAAREAEIFKLENEYKVAKVERSANANRLENEYKQAKNAAEQENRRLNEEYRLAQKQYQESLEDIPRLQKEAQAEHSRNVVKNAEEIEKSFPKDSKILTNQVGVQEFIDESINSTGLAGSREGAQASRFLKSLFPEGEFITSKELSKRYKAIEDGIQRANPEVQEILANFKNHLGKKIPVILEDTVAYSKIMPSLAKQLEKDMVAILKEIPFGKGEEATRTLLAKRADANIKQLLRQIGPDDFVRKIQSGEISKMLRDGILNSEDFLINEGFSNFAKLRKEGMFEIATKALNDKHVYFANEIEKRINSKLARSEIKAMQAGKDASKKLGRTIKNTYGIAEPIAPGVPPTAPEAVSFPQQPVEIPPVGRPNIPPPIAPPQEPPIPFKPSLRSDPTAPVPQTFSPQPEPLLPSPQNFADSAGDFLEKTLLKGRGNANSLLKLGALKYALGPAALPLEAAALGSYGAAKLLTSPGAAGQVARLSFKQAGIQAIVQMAEKYPSYHDGVLESPQERRSLTKEIENDPEIPLEQKAILQSKVNRGTPLSQRLQ